MDKISVCSACKRDIGDEELRMVLRFYPPREDIKSPIVICTDCLVSFSIYAKLDTAERAFGS